MRRFIVPLVIVGLLPFAVFAQGTGDVLLEETASETTVETEEEVSADAEPSPEIIVPLELNDFDDIDADAWYAQYVSAMLGWRIMSGYRTESGTPLGLFGPSDPVTVTQLLKMAMIGAKADLTNCGTARNPQATGHWAADYVACAEKNEYRLFRRSVPPDRPIERGEAVGLLHDVLKTEVPDLPSAFVDTANSPYKSDIAFDAAREILTGPTDWKGKPTGWFLPKDTLNRAEAAKMLYLSLHTTDLNSVQSLYPVDLHLTVKNFAFDPPELTVNRGQPVTIRFSLTGRHTFTIEELRIYKTLLLPTETLTFTPTTRGTFVFHCEMPGHAAGGMVGKLIVR
ncbi:cupredoxin domain-containing protein [Candidatus Peregrinibacteria bacterium]|nr:cupredoxin domain-containing protein [Candidatus Peregrinibacteria bacterium]